MADSLQFYLNQVGKYPLLTAEQEIQLSRRIFRWLQLKDMPGQRTKQELLRCDLAGEQKTSLSATICDLL